MWQPTVMVVAAAAALAAAAPAGDGVFCSRTQVQETAVRQQLLDTGQMVVSTHVLTSLRVGETVCISATLPEPPSPPTQRTPPDADDPNETRLMNLLEDEPPDTASPGSSEQTASSSSEIGASEDSLTSLAESGVPSEDPRADAGAAHSADGSPPRSDGGRGERAARLPDSAAESGLSRLLLPAALPRRRPAPPPPTDLPRLRIQLTLESVQHRHAVTSAYEFSEPQLDVTCTCACASFHTCSPCGALCVSKAATAMVADCDGSLLGSAHTCCELRLRPGRRFSAVRLGAAVTFLRLRVAVTELGGAGAAATERQTVEVRLGDQLQLDLNSTRLRLSAGSRGDVVAPPGWYVLDQGDVYRPQQINELNEYNLQKLGWLKRRGDEHLMPTAGRLAAAVDIVTDSCTEQRFQVRGGHVLLDSTLPQLGPALVDLRVAERSATHLRLLPSAPGRPVWLGLHLRHLQRLHYLVHRARLADFDGALHVDARGAVLAELRLWNGSGVQHGWLTVGRQPAPYRFSLVAARHLRLRLPVALDSEQRTARLCLRPEGSDAAPLCRHLPVTRQPAEMLREDASSERQLTVDGQANPTNTVERFLRALNPATWLKSGGSWTSALGAVVDLALVALAVTLVWKCVACCRSCCCRRAAAKK